MMANMRKLMEIVMAPDREDMEYFENGKWGNLPKPTRNRFGFDLKINASDLV
jgi:hypothetical protein